MIEGSSPTGGGNPNGVTVVVDDVQSDVPVDTSRWQALAAGVLIAEGLTGELTLTFVDRDEITGLKVEHFGDPGEFATDVLAFPLDAMDDNADGTPVLLGDVVICPAVAAEQYSTHAGSLDDELALLVVHGVLHIVGHDHADEEDDQLMRRREIELLESLHWGGPTPAGFSNRHREGDR